MFGDGVEQTHAIKTLSRHSAAGRPWVAPAAWITPSGPGAPHRRRGRGGIQQVTVVAPTVRDHLMARRRGVTHHLPPDEARGARDQEPRHPGRNRPGFSSTISDAMR